jgi:hypothetical protein
MNHKSIIFEMKCDSYLGAVDKALSVKNSEGLEVGYLVPVGKWVLTDLEKIELIRAWRQKAMRMYLVQFDSTFERTYKYLSELSIGDEQRLFFLIFDSNKQFIGHIGISNCTEKSFELDNLMRGRNGGDPRLIYFSEVAILNWAFSSIGALSSVVRVVSYNWMVIDLHEEVGYGLKERKKIIQARDGWSYYPLFSNWRVTECEL